ncbi:MAG: DNA polymerase III subunit gamma/tau [Clostridia bacterium]|nr:DNA polymerase III subunit gamma/tau [Clostridia bacterium]
MYQALYRKWRPKTFDDMSGQAAVRQVLRQEVESGQLSHAYLFCGTRGTGKTTAAKILAKAVNCRNPKNGNPCNECDICRGIDDGSILDVLEIDAASNNGVDNIREIRDEVQYTPALTRYRVYIIDEVHMLSSGAFNALLKTLEEPPKHAIFILATTERHRIPATIVSRCQCFDFVRIPAEEIVARLQTVAEAEHIRLTPRAAALIARLSDGALRNALSLLDQCAVSGQEITLEIVSQIAGLSGRRELFDVSAALAAQDNAAILAAAQRLGDASQDLTQSTAELLTHFRDLLLCKSVKDPEALLASPPDEFEALRARAQELTAGDLLSAIQTLREALDNMARSSQKQVLLELALLELTTPQLDASPAHLLSRLEKLENRLASGEWAAVQHAPQTVRQEAETKTPAKERDKGDLPPWELPSSPEAAAALSPAAAPAAAPVQPKPLPANGAAPDALPPFWGDLLASVDPSVSGFLRSAEATLQGDVLTVVPGSSFAGRMLQKESVLSQISEVLSRVAGRPCTLRIGEQESKEPSASNPLFEQLANKIEALQQEEK